MLTKVIVTPLALLMIVFTYSAANPKLGVTLGIFSSEDLDDRTATLVIAGLGAAISGSLLLLQVIRYQREKYLLSQGTAARATYTGYYSEIRNKQSYARKTYAFTDSRGELVQGEISTLVVQIDTRPETIKLEELNNEKPFVLFDPRNSARHMIYPGTLAKFR